MIEIYEAESTTVKLLLTALQTSKDLRDGKQIIHQLLSAGDSCQSAAHCHQQPQNSMKSTNHNQVGKTGDEQGTLREDQTQSL